MSAPSSGSKSSACYFLHAVFLLGLFFGPEDRNYMFLETSVIFQQTTWRYTPEDRNSNNELIDNRQLYKYVAVSYIYFNEKRLWGEGMRVWLKPQRGRPTKHFRNLWCNYLSGVRDSAINNNGFWIR
jgi:hypothetical protein